MTAPASPSLALCGGLSSSGAPHALTRLRVVSVCFHRGFTGAAGSAGRAFFNAGQGSELFSQTSYRGAVTGRKAWPPFSSVGGVGGLFRPAHVVEVA